MTEIKCFHSPWADEIQLAVFVTEYDGVRKVAEPLTLRVFKRDEYLSEPTLRMRSGEAQGLMDELWRCGLRPTEGTGSAGSLKATENHLADMRRIALRLLEGDGE